MRPLIIVAMLALSFPALAQAWMRIGSMGQPQAPLHIGNSTRIGNSVDPQALISRKIDSNGTGNAHAFTDASEIDRAGGIGYASFDAGPEYDGSENYDHYAAFQNSAVYGSTGTMTNIYTLFHNPIVNNGNVNNAFGLRIRNISGTGTVLGQIAIFIDNLTKGTALNWAIYTDGTTPSYFGGNMFLGSLMTTGSAGGKKVVCVDVGTGRLYASSTGTDCSN